MNQDKIYRRCLPAEKRIKEKYFWCPLLLTGTLVKGARQVGKTHLIRRVLKEEGCDVFEVNLIETPEAVSILQQAGTVDELMIGLSALGGQRLQKGKTVIFIDEIQKYKEMVTKIKFLVDDGSFRYVLSGSLQGVDPPAFFWSYILKAHYSNAEKVYLSCLFCIYTQIVKEKTLWQRLTEA